MLLKSRHKPLYQFSSSMIEVLVALLPISVGVLGMIAVQGKTVQYTADSVECNKAITLGSNLLENMRASPKVLYNIKDQMATQSDLFKAKGSAFPITPSSYTPLPNAIKDRLGCWVEQMKNKLPGAGGLLESDHCVCRSSKPDGCDGKDSMLEIHPAWRGKQGARINAAGSNADTSLCYHTLGVEP